MNPSLKRQLLIILLILAMPLITLSITSFPIPHTYANEQYTQESKVEKIPLDSNTASFSNEISADSTEQKQENYSITSAVPSFISNALIKLFEPMTFITLLIAGFTLGLYITGKDTAKKQLRAYVGIRPHEDYPPIFLEQLHNPGLMFQIVNYGQTPATNVRHEIAIGAFNDESDLEEMKFVQGGSNFVLHPNATSDLGATRDTQLERSAIRAIEEGVIKLFVWGEIRYEDIYGHERVTKFRFMQGPKALVWTKKGNEAT